MTPSTINIILNLLGIVLGGGALVGVLRFLNNRQSIRNADEADVRDHYAEILTGLRAERDAADERYNAALAAADRRLADCEDWANKSRDVVKILREKVDDQQQEIDGLKRQIVRYSAHQAVLLDEQGEGPSEEVVSAARRVAKITKGARTQNPDHSDVLNAAEDTVHDTRQAHATAKDACEEIKRSEDGEEKD